MRIRLTLLAIVLLASRPVAAQPAPYHRWRTLDTPHFHVHARAGLEHEARVAGAAAERAYALLARELVAPRGPIDLVVSDDADEANGYATPYPSNRIVVFTTPPIEAPELSLSEDWLQEVVTHELTHVFHLDRSRGLWSGAQRIFGRAPVLFPNEYSPSWLTEGLAVYYESRLTPGGRLRSAWHRSVARAAALDDLLPHLGDLSLSSPLFPGGSDTYVYGSLFFERLAAQHGDSSVPRFVEAQSREWFPLLQEGAAHDAFGQRLAPLFDEWRDSVARTVRGAAHPTVWRELTVHPWYAAAPRWVNDTTLVYTGGDGRDANAAWLVTTSGVRTQLGRRSSLGASVPLRDGGFLFAQPEYDGTAEIRSDLYVERDGAQQRLTHGARLLQPDARADGDIVAVQLDRTSARLVLLDRDGRQRRVLRDALPDETWSEPRWSPDGSRIAAAHRLPGGIFSIELVDAPSGDHRAVVRRGSILGGPSWARDGRAILFTSEETGTPQVMRVDLATDKVMQLSDAATALATPEVSPNGALLAASLLRGDGVRVVIAPLPTPVDTARMILSVVMPGGVPRADTVTGAFRAFSALPSLAPRYWLPILDGGVVDGTRVGAFTSGQDVVGRHAYVAQASVETSGRYASAELDYRYAGLRRPYIDLSVLQDWESAGTVYLYNGSLSTSSNVVKRTRDLSAAATFVRPRERTFASLTAGLGVEQRAFALDDNAIGSPFGTGIFQRWTYPRAFLGATFANTRRPILSISSEDGVKLAATVRERYRTDSASATRSKSIVATAAGFRALTLPGFAHHVLALRGAVGIADAAATTAFEVGGTSSTALEIGGQTVSEGSRTFGVRGFPSASIYGTHAFAGSAEYRAPLRLGGKGLWPVPLFFDRSSVTAFTDVGWAGCATNPVYAFLCSGASATTPLGGAGGPGSTMIASVGAELGVSVAILQHDLPDLVRVGLAVPTVGRIQATRKVDAASVYVAFGASF